MSVTNTIPAIPASQLVNIVPSELAAGGSPLQFWGMFVDSNLGANGYPLIPMGVVLLFADMTDVESYFGGTSQEAGISDVYFTGPINATRSPSGLLMTQYALNAVPAYLRGGNVSGLSLGQLQAIDANLTVSIDGTPITESVNLATATSFSNAAELIGVALAVKGIQKGTFTASLSTTTMTVSALLSGPQQATVVANLIVSGDLMVVTSVTGGYLQVGQVVSGTGITPGTTIASYSGGGQPGGVGTYVLSAAPSAETAVTVSAFAAAPVIALGDVVTGTGITAYTYVSAFLTGTGGIGTYTISASASTEAGETITSYAPGCSYSPLHGSFDIHSGTSGSGSSVSFASGPAATLLLLTQATGAIQSAGAAASSPTTFMDAITLQTQNWVSFMTTWEPTDADKATNAASSFAAWNSAQQDGYRYCMWETNVIDTESGSGPSAAVAAINNADYSGVVPIYTNPAITTLAGEKAAFSMGWAASLDFTRLNGRQTAAFKSYVGGLPDVTNGTIAEVLAGAPQSGEFGYGINFYGLYTTRSQGFPEYQRGTISGPFVWDDTYTDQIWLNAGLQNAIMIGLANANSVPYANPGYAQIESWCLDPIGAAVNFGAIVAGVELSQAQIQEVNTAAGIEIDQTLTQRGWYLQIQPATAATRAIRASPPCTFFWCDGGSVQAITLASITVQ
jgi:hypothetical protein